MFFCCPFLGSALVFVEKQEKADMLFKDLLKTSYPCLSLHGGKIRSSHPCIVFISSPVPTVPEKKLKNGALFLRLGVPSTLIHREKGTFRKRSSNQKNLKTPAFRFCLD